MGKLTDKVAKGVFWVLLEKFGVQAAHFVVTLVLARLLTPNDYGTVALLAVFIEVANVFVDCGFGKALVQKKTATQTDYNTVFYLSLSFAAALYVLLFCAAPSVARFYGIPDLEPMLRVLALSLVFHSVNGVQNVELNRKMLFQLSFRISWVRVAVSSTVGISCAVAGYGPWALVWSSLAGGIAGVVARQLVIRWRPALSFSWASARDLFRFGWKLLVSALVDRFYSNLQSLLIGKFYKRADLAFVNKGRHIPNLVANLVSDSLRRVSFPALAKMQDERERLRNAMRRVVRTSSFLVFPLMTALAVLADTLVELLFGSPWLPAVPYLRIICFSAMLRQVDIVNKQAIMALGRSDIALWLIIVRRVMCLVVMAFTLRLGVLVFFASSTLIVVPLGFVMNAFPNHILLRYTVGMQLRDMAAGFWLSAVAGAALYATSVLPFNPMLMLPFQFVGFFALYAALTLLFRPKPLCEIASVLAQMAGRKLKPESAVTAFLSRLAARGSGSGAATAS